MKILLISYDNYKYDGRLRELIQVAKELGEVTYITRASDTSSTGTAATAAFCCLSVCRRARSAGRI